MTGPLDYSGAFADVPSPIAAFTQGLQGGAMVQQVTAQQQQQQLQAQQQQQMRTDLAALSANPTPQAIGQMSIKYPQLSEGFKRSFDMLSPAQQQSKLESAVPVHAAVLAGEYGIASKQLREHATALENSGNDMEARQTRAMADLIEQHPETAKLTTGMLLSQAMGPEKYAAAFGDIGKEGRAAAEAPADLSKKVSDAKKAGADAAVAVGTIPAMIQKPVEENLSAAAKRRIDDLNVQIGQADSETKRGQLVLERDKFIAEQAKTQTALGTDTQNQLDTIGQSIATIKSLKDDPLLDSWFGVGTTTGKLLGMIPGTDNKDFRARVDTLKAQQFLTQAKEMKGMGALSDAEGARIERAVASLDTDQSKGAFKNALGVIMTTLEKGQNKIIASGKLPKTGGAFVVKSPTFGNVNEGDINRLLVQYPGATREQVMMYLNGAK